MEFAYTSQGRETTIPGVDDAKDFQETLRAFSLLKIGDDRQQEILRILAGVLYLGNIQFMANGDIAAIAVCRNMNAFPETRIQAESADWLEKLCSDLYGVDAANLRKWLTAREIRAAGESVFKPETVQQSVANRDALAKLIYSCTFHWVVRQVNENLLQEEAATRSRLPTPARFMGVLVSGQYSD